MMRSLVLGFGLSLALACSALGQTISPAPLPTPVSIANGGTNCSAATITCFNNITGLTASGTTGTTSTNLVFSTSPTLATPALGVATATSVAVGGCTIGANVLCTTGGVAFSAALSAGAISGTTFTAGAANTIGWNSRGLLTSNATGNVQIGNGNVASPIAQVLSTQGTVGGTTSNGAGANLTIQSGLGTGNATGSLLILQTPHAGSTGTTQQTANTQISLGDNTVGMPNLASSSAATTGTVCWTTVTGNLTVDTTVACLASDVRLKNVIGPLQDGLAEVLKLKPITYTLKSDPMHLGVQVGLSAQDVQAVDPRLVSLYAAGPDKGTPQGVRYMQLTAVLVQAIQELTAKNTALETRLSALEHPHHHHRHTKH